MMNEQLGPECKDVAGFFFAEEFILEEEGKHAIAGVMSQYLHLPSYQSTNYDR